MQKFVTHSENETMALAEALCKKIRGGSIVLFSGEMGAGKTAFVRGALHAYDNKAFVSSPTFALVNDYGGEPHIYHFDMYRVRNSDDLYSTGFYDYMGEDSILFIEWSENIRADIEDAFGCDIISIDIQKTENENERIFSVSGGPFA